MRRPTIIDVARRAGVSKSTVSLVLRNSPLVREATRTAVRAAMNELDYIYNRAAANMRTANAGLIGFVINDLRNPFFTQFAASLQMTLSVRNYSAVMANTNEDPALQDQVVRAMIEHGVAAIVISPAYGEVSATFDAIANAGVPAMQVLRKVDPRIDLFPFAAPDYRQGSRLAAEHLLECGAKRIAFAGGLGGRDVTCERMSGYVSVLEAGRMEPIVLTGQASRSFGHEVVRRLRTEFGNVDAAICFNDLVAMGMLSAFARIGERVGTQFRIVGFDDIEDCSQIYPSLSSVHCDIAAFGGRIAETVLAWLEEGSAPEAELRTPVRLVVRESSRGETPQGRSDRS